METLIPITFKTHIGFSHVTDNQDTPKAVFSPENTLENLYTSISNAYPKTEFTVHFVKNKYLEEGDSDESSETEGGKDGIQSM